MNSGTDDTKFPWQTWATLLVWNDVEGNWKLRCLTGGLWYFHDSNDISLFFWAHDMNSVTDDTKFHRQTRATTYVLDGVEGNWKLWCLTGGLWYSYDSRDDSLVFREDRWILSLTTRSSLGRHEQPCTSGTASKETGSFNIHWHFHTSCNDNSCTTDYISPALWLCWNLNQDHHCRTLYSLSNT